jgi:hypothetical protein
VIYCTAKVWADINKIAASVMMVAVVTFANIKCVYLSNGCKKIRLLLEAL